MKRRKKSVGLSKVVGMDLSLNHGAIVCLDRGRLWRVLWATTKAAASKRKDATRIDIPKNLQREEKEVWRLDWWAKYLREVLESLCPDVVAFEGYAMGKSQRAHQIGELGGVARLACWQIGVRFRIYDPSTIKMFATHNGGADKDEVGDAVKERWGVNFDSLDPPSRSRKKRKETSEDLYDAYAIARLAWTEVWLRRGVILLSDLHEKEIQAFNRVTRANPENLLSKDWLRRR